MNILLQAGGGGPMSTSLIFMVAIIAIFYFFMIRPQQKKQKQIQRAREAMQIGDRVITAGGIHGRIREINDAFFIVEVARDVTIKVDKASVFSSAADVGN